MSFRFGRKDSLQIIFILGSWKSGQN
jgi:hypothetical protein